MTRPDATIQLGPDPHLLEQRVPTPWLVYEAVAHRGVTYLIQDDALPEPCSASVRQHQTSDGEMRMTAGIT